jgi:hypothetical protein
MFVVLVNCRSTTELIQKWYDVGKDLQRRLLLARAEDTTNIIVLFSGLQLCSSRALKQQKLLGPLSLRSLSWLRRNNWVDSFSRVARAMHACLTFHGVNALLPYTPQLEADTPCRSARRVNGSSRQTVDTGLVPALLGMLRSVLDRHFTI